MIRLIALLVVLVVPVSVRAQVEFTSSNLPIVLIDTDGVAVPDEPKIPGRMSIIDNGPGARNAVTDTPNDYVGVIGIEVRGASSQRFPKKQYGIETRDEDGDDLNVSVLGMPEENDWILSAPYSDKSLLRNVLAYHMARETGRYATRTRFCEVVLNGEYQGVYVLMEKIKRDDARVDINKLKPDETSGDDLTGGYIIQIDRPDDPGWYSTAGPPSANRVYYQYREPGGDEIVQEQRDYIQGFIAEFESMMASGDIANPATGYPATIDVGSFVDFILLNEAARNVDGYRLSTYLHKDKDSNDPLLHAGPAWDFNLGFGNVNYLTAVQTEGFQYASSTVGHPQAIRFWWSRLAEDPAFRDSTRARWTKLRRGPFHTDSLFAFIDSQSETLGEAQDRNFERWPVLGTYVWPNSFIGDTYAEEVDYLKRWLAERLTWLDGQLVVSTDGPVDADSQVMPAFPNPARGRVEFEIRVGTPQHVTAQVFSARGRLVATLFDGLAASGRRVRWNAGGAAPGVYLVRVSGETFESSQTVSILGR